MFTADTLNQYVLVLMHFPGTIGRQIFLTGLQKKMEANTPHSTEGTRAANRSHVSRRMVRVGKMRRYWVKIEALVTWMRTT